MYKSYNNFIWFFYFVKILNVETASGANKIGIIMLLRRLKDKHLTNLMVLVERK